MYKKLQFKQLMLFFIMLFTVNVFAQEINVEKEIDTLKKIETENLNKAIIYADSILQYNFKNKKEIALLNGYNYLKAFQYTKAKELFKNYIDNNTKTSNELGNAYLGYAQATAYSGSKNEALKYTFKALDISKELNNEILKAESITILAQVHYNFDDFTNAIKFSKEAIKIHKKSKDFKKIAILYNNIAVFFDTNLDSAQYYNLKALELNKIGGDKYSIATSYFNLGLNYFKKKEYDKAIDNFKESIEITEEINNDNCYPYFYIAMVYLRTDDIKNATKYLSIAMNNAIKTNDYVILERIYAKFLKITLKEKEFEKALVYQAKKDSIHLINRTLENTDKLKMVEIQHNQYKKEEKLKQDIVITKKNNLILIILTIFLLFLGVFIGLLLLQHSKNKRLTLKHEKLVLEQKVLSAQMNPHFIFNTLTSIQNSLLENDTFKSSILISKFAKLTQQNFEFLDKDLIDLDDDLDALKNYIEMQQLRFNFDYKITISEDIDPSFVEIPPMLLQPFVENAIEHGLKPKEQKGHLEIDISTDNNLVLFKVIDNGVGFKKEVTKSNRTHALDIFINRLKLRKKDEEKSFVISSLSKGTGTVIEFSLKL